MRCRIVVNRLETLRAIVSRTNGVVDEITIIKLSR